jgi:hypothetical protein
MIQQAREDGGRGEWAYDVLVETRIEVHHDGGEEERRAAPDARRPQGGRRLFLPAAGAWGAMIPERRI